MASPMNSTLSSLVNDITMATNRTDAFTTTPLTYVDNELEFWSPSPKAIESFVEINESMKISPFYDSPLVSTVKLALFMMVQSPLSAACVQGCSNVLKSSLMSIVGPSNDEIFAPFHAIITKSRTNIAAQRKIGWICHSMRKFDNCMKPCMHSRAKAIRKVTVHQWQTICDASKMYPKHFGEFIGCEKRHHERAIRKCPILNVPKNPSLDIFCKSINVYTDCYSKVIFRCPSKNATKIWNTINEAIKLSYSRILELSTRQIDMPVECEWAMRNSDLYRHAEDETIGDDEYLIETISLNISTTTTIKSTHREPENDEYNLDYWQGVSEQPLIYQPLLSTQSLKDNSKWTTTNSPNYQTPFLADPFNNSVYPMNCSIFHITSFIFLLAYFRRI